MAILAQSDIAKGLTFMTSVNLEKFANEQYKTGVKARDVIREAVTNSIQAGAHNIFVDLVFSKNNEKNFLSRISIKDDGEGFTEENIKYFDEVCTSHKDNIGGKGVGRIAFLKFANKVNIESQTKDQLVKFDYTFKFNPSQVTYIKKKDSLKTIIYLESIKNPVNTKVRQLITSLCEDFYLFLFLSNKKSGNININFRHNSNQEFPNNYSLSSNDIKVEMEEKFEIKGEIFKSYLFKYPHPKKGIFASLCANELCVEEHIISKNFDSCRYQISVTSEYFNKLTNLERKRLEIPDSSDIIDNISKDEILKTIRDQCIYMINQISPDEIKYFKEKNIQKIRKYYPFVNSSSLSDNSTFLDADDIIKTYRVQQAKKEDSIAENLKKGNIPPYKDITDLASDDLARFIVHRALVIESLNNLPDNSAEDIIHSAILPKKSNGDNIRENNVWIIDDKFLSYSNVFSDETLSKIIKDVNNNIMKKEKRRPDVAAFFSKDNLGHPNKLVIIEFKKPSSDVYDNNKALAQCRHYADRLVSEIKTIREVFAFAITNIDDESYKDMKQQGFSDIFSLAEKILYRDYLVGEENDIPLHLYVTPLKSLLKDAKSRNKVFEDILRFEL